MSEAIKQVFADKKEQDEAAFVTFVTAGYPTADSTVPLMMALEAGGADIIELGMPFSDPIGDGPTIQKSNTIAIENGVDYPDVLEYVREARRQGLKTPVLLMGYFNPLMAYGEEKAVQDAHEAGANGYIIVDLPPEEAVKFRNICTASKMSYVPLISPATKIDRVKFLASIADSFIYVVSKMGVTGSNAETDMSASLPELIKRIQTFTPVPLAVGFGIDNRTHFDYVTSAGADGVVIGSKIVKVIEGNPNGAPQAVEAYCRTISLKGNAPKLGRKNKQVSNDDVPAPLPIPALTLSSSLL